MMMVVIMVLMMTLVMMLMEIVSDYHFGGQLVMMVNYWLHWW
jgi:hypothetical protein